VETHAGSAPAEGQRARWFHLIAAVGAGIWALRLAVATQPHSFLDWINLAFHEAGHLFLAPFGRMPHLLGGTLLQLTVPALLAGYFLYQASPFSASACLWWLGENLVNVSVYMADARELQLELVGGGEHDWNEIFYRAGLLGQESVARVSALTHHLGVVVMATATAWMVCLALPADVRESLGSRLSRRFPAAGLLIERPGVDEMRAPRLRAGR
jgi:hypothetical protein